MGQATKIISKARTTRELSDNNIYTFNLRRKLPDPTLFARRLKIWELLT